MNVEKSGPTLPVMALYFGHKGVVLMGLSISSDCLARLWRMLMEICVIPYGNVPPRGAFIVETNRGTKS